MVYTQRIVSFFAGLSPQVDGKVGGERRSRDFELQYSKFTLRISLRCIKKRTEEEARKVVDDEDR